MFALKIVYGVRNPKPRTEKYIRKKIDKYELNNFKHYKLSADGFVNYFSNVKKFKLSNSSNGLFIFNRKKQLLKSKDTITCSLQIDNRFKHIERDNYVCDTILFDSIFSNKIYPLFDGNNVKYEFDTLKDYTFVLTWATYSGKLNKINTKQWADSISSIIKTNPSINAFFLNLDIQKDWDTLDWSIK